MAEHAKYPPSAWDRLSVCLLSLYLEVTQPDTVSPYAEFGTRLHKDAEAHLRAGTNTDLNGGRHADIVQTYLDHVRAESVGGDLLIEQKLTFNTDLWGTADAVIFQTRTVQE